MKPYRAESKSLLPAALAAALLVLLSWTAAPLAAQDETEDVRAEASTRAAAQSGPVEQEMVEVEHADPQRLAQVLRIFPVHVQAHPEFGLLTLRGSRADLDAAVAAARRLDVPGERSPSVEVVAHVLQASRAGSARGTVPAGLAEVADQLRNVFGFQEVVLLDSLIVRASDRSASEIRGTLSTGQGPSFGYRFGFNRLSLVAPAADEGGREVHLDGLVFETDSPGGDVRLVTDLEVREGQKAVVGKAPSGRTPDESLILVMEVRVLE